MAAQVKLGGASNAPRDPKPKKQKRVNLLIQEDFEHTTLGRILNWSLSAGRVIVIITELIVILAFLSRFWLDRQLTDLNEQNNFKKNQIEAQASFEQDFRKAQKTLAAYKKLTETQILVADKIKKISAALPADVSLDKVSFVGVDNDLQISGLSLSEAGLAGFIKALEDSGQFGETKLAEVSLGLETQQVLKFLVKTSFRK